MTLFRRLFVFAGSAYLPFVAGNALAQIRVTRGDDEPGPSTRLGAFASTKDFPPGTVGAGARFNIQLLHLGLGELGANEIGDFFRAPASQELMAMQSNSAAGTAANQQLAEGEYAVWVKSYEDAKGELVETPSRAAFEKFVGGFLGSSASVDVRVALMDAASTSTAVLPRATSPAGVATAGFALAQASYCVVTRSLLAPLAAPVAAAAPPPPKPPSGPPPTKPPPSKPPPAPPGDG